MKSVKQPLPALGEGIPAQTAQRRRRSWRVRLGTKMRRFEEAWWCCLHHGGLAPVVLEPFALLTLRAGRDGQLAETDLLETPQIMRK